MDRLVALREEGSHEQEWQKAYYKQYIRKQLEAINYLCQGMTRKEVIEKVGCTRESLSSWIDMYLEGQFL